MQAENAINHNYFPTYILAAEDPFHGQHRLSVNIDHKSKLYSI